MLSRGACPRSSRYGAYNRAIAGVVDRLKASPIAYNGAMALSFDRGDVQSPCGHALLYFRDRDGDQVLASYVLVLPIKMDMGKYLPPLLASQLGSMVTESLSGPLTSFAAPPMPEVVDSVEALGRLAGVRGDDLVNGGDIVASDVAMAMQATAEATQAYAALYTQYLESQPVRTEIQGEGTPSGADVQRVVYELLSERDRLAELSKLVGTLRFALERGDANLVGEAEASIATLEELLADRYWVAKIRGAAQDMSDRGATLARLYLDRCFRLVAEDYAAVEALEQQIAVAERSTS